MNLKLCNQISRCLGMSLICTIFFNKLIVNDISNSQGEVMTAHCGPKLQGMGVTYKENEIHIIAHEQAEDQKKKLKKRLLSFVHFTIKILV